MSYEFPLAFHSAYGPKIVSFLRQSKITVENRNIFIPPAFITLVRGISVGVLSYTLVWKNYNGVATRR